jgi:hypothetical protein
MTLNLRHQDAKVRGDKKKHMFLTREKDRTKNYLGDTNMLQISKPLD